VEPDAPHPTLRRVAGALMLLAGASVFLVRLQHEGPYGFPRGGNLFGGLGALLLGAWLWRPRPSGGRLAAPLVRAALAACPVVLFFALYATLAELEEVVVLRATDGAGRPADLRLWIVDEGDAAWVTMPRSKAAQHGLDGARLELLRDGALACVVPALHDERERVNAVHRLRHEKYAVQRLATVIGLFEREAGAHTVALRLDPCPAP